MRNQISLYFLSFVCLALFGTSTMSSCTRSQRQDTLRVTAVAVGTARDQYVAWDRVHQQELVDAAQFREDAQRVVTDYRASQNQASNWFVTAAMTQVVAQDIEGVTVDVDVIAGIKRFTDGLAANNAAIDAAIAAKPPRG